METTTVIGKYGLTDKPSKCVVIIAQKNDYSWYCVKGSMNINKTYDTIEDGTDVESLHDIDSIHWDKPINTERQLIKAING